MSTIAPSSTPDATRPHHSLDGKLVMDTTSPKVYLVINGHKCWVETPDVYTFLFGDNWGLIQKISPERINTTSDGPSLGTRVYVATVTGSYPYWLIDDRKHLFASEAVFDAYPFDSGCIKTVSQTVLNGFKQGFTIHMNRSDG